MRAATAATCCNRRALTAVFAAVFSLRRKMLIFLQQLSFVHMLERHAVLAELTRKIRLATMVIQKNREHTWACFVNF